MFLVQAQAVVDNASGEAGFHECAGAGCHIENCGHLVLVKDCIEKADGLDSIRKKGEALVSNVQEIKSRTVSDEIIVGDNHISLGISLDAILKDDSPFKFSEVVLYEVANGKIISELFYY